jgi:hypothetical protein
VGKRVRREGVNLLPVRPNKHLSLCDQALAAVCLADSAMGMGLSNTYRDVPPPGSQLKQAQKRNLVGSRFMSRFAHYMWSNFSLQMAPFFDLGLTNPHQRSPENNNASVDSRTTVF